MTLYFNNIYSLLYNIFNYVDIIPLLIITGNIFLLFFSYTLLNYFFHENDKDQSFKLKLLIFRLMNCLMIVLTVYHVSYAQDVNKPLIIKLLSIVIVLYIGYFSTHLANYFIIRKYGDQRNVNNEKRLSETYSSRLFGLIVTIFIGIIALISIIRILELDSLLEAGGVIGFIGVFLALTQSTWAPDIFSGLIILNSNSLKEGDVIEFKADEAIYGLVYKTKMFHTEILNLVDNHRVMIRNERLRDFTINNLSRFASAKGLREKLIFKIGYDVPTKQVDKFISLSFEKIKQKQIAIEIKHGIDYGLQDTGDHAIEWAVFYYTKSVDQLPKIRMQIMACFYESSEELGISLSTPLTHIYERIT